MSRDNLDDWGESATHIYRVNHWYGPTENLECVCHAGYNYAPIKIFLLQ